MEELAQQFSSIEFRLKRLKHTNKWCIKAYQDARRICIFTNYSLQVAIDCTRFALLLATEKANADR